MPRSPKPTVALPHSSRFPNPHHPLNPHSHSRAPAPFPLTKPSGPRRSHRNSVICSLSSSPLLIPHGSPASRTTFSTHPSSHSSASSPPNAAPAQLFSRLHPTSTPGRDTPRFRASNASSSARTLTTTTTKHTDYVSRCAHRHPLHPALKTCTSVFATTTRPFPRRQSPVAYLLHGPSEAY